MKLVIFILMVVPGLAMALDVATLHPLLTDLTKQVGGDRVKVVEIGKPGMNVHHFEPQPRDIKAMASVKIVFASGKGLEAYLEELSDNLGIGQTVVEVGKTIPSQEISRESLIYACCPDHAEGGIDPHWWHNVANMQRAVRVIEKALIAADPDGKKIYAANSRTAMKELRELDRWVKAEIAKIPEKKRHLVTAHAAFGYFCAAYGFKATFVQGLSAEGEVPADQLAKSIKQLRTEAIPMVFPEKTANPKVLAQIAKQSGAKVGKPLIADGSVDSYQEMIETNVNAIVAGLSGKKQPKADKTATKE